MFPFTASGFLDMQVSGNRINEFLVSEEVNLEYITWTDNNANDDLAIEVKNGNFFWVDPKKEKFVADKKTYEDALKKKKCCGAKPKFGEIQDGKSDSTKKSSNSAKKINMMQTITESKIDKYLAEPLMGSDQATDEDLRSDHGSLMLEDKTADSKDSNMPKMNLKDINIQIKKGACIGIIGKVGSGKSSLLTSLFADMYEYNPSTYSTGLGQAREFNGSIATQQQSIYDPESLEDDLYAKPQVKVNGSVSYVSQQTWIQSITLKDNILFYEEEDPIRYAEAIRYSAMEPDIEIMADGDLTLLGEKGLNLSGGQKVRLNIARALYANKDIILLDDPISALDVNVGGFIMEYMISDYLKDKTRVIATHAIQFLKYFDYIYIMDDGQIVKEGDYETVIATDEYKAIAKEAEKMAELKKQESAKAGTKAPTDEVDLTKVLSKITRQDSANFQRQDSTDLKQRESVGSGRKDSTDLKRNESDIYMGRQDSLDDAIAQPQPGMPEADLKDPAEVPLTALATVDEGLDKDEMEKVVRNITHAEDRATGGIGCDVILNFVKMSGGAIVFYLMGALIAIYVALQCYGTLYLQDWTEEIKSGERRELSGVLKFIGIWGAISIGANLTVTFRSLYNFDRILRVAKYLNFYMTFKLLYTSMARFWDRVPLGRVLNRFTRDQNVVDREMGFGINIFVAAIMTCLLDFIMASYSSTSYLWFFIVFYFLCCFLMQRYYMHALRELTRLNAITNTPVVQIFSETLQGINMVRLFRKQKDTRNAYYNAIDENYKNQMMLQGVRSWFKIRIEFFSLLIIIPGFILCLYLAPSPGAFAVMLKYTLSITEDIGMLMTAMSNNENRFISFERCYHFTQLEPEEGYRGLEETEKRFFAGKSLTDKAAPQEQWMTSGELEFKKFSCRYRDDLPMVLKSIDLKVRAGTKVGIVGRTGAGKTTLIKAIYRTFQKYEGEILIDGHEIQTLDVQSLRSRITIIPQDPHLFLDSLRNNLDPQRKFRDDEIIKILQDFGIWDKFEGEKTGGLAFEVQEGGSNLSAGEKQLLVMARALLSKNKLILLDEATANIDVRTETLIQKAVETSFKDCTILMIAHRLNTILFCDKVLCMDKGIVVEYGKTKRLAEDPNSWFGGLIKKGADIEEALR